MIRFGTGGWREVIGDGFTRANIQRIGCALGRRVAREGGDTRVAVGYDRRFLSREAAIWLSEALAGLVLVEWPRLIAAVSMSGTGFGIT